MEQALRDELLSLLKRESYFERELILSSGRSSKYYIDCRRILYLGRGAYLAGELMLDLVLAQGVTQIGGMAMGALPITDAVIAAAYRRGVRSSGSNLRVFVHGRRYTPIQRLKSFSVASLYGQRRKAPDWHLRRSDRSFALASDAQRGLCRA